MTWTQVTTAEQISDMLHFMEQADIDIYRIPNRKGWLDNRIATLLSEVSGESPSKCMYYYEDGNSKGFIRLERSVNEQGRTVGRILNFCSYGFDAYVFANIQAAVSVLMEKCREIFDAWGIVEFSCSIPRTPVGECIAQQADTRIWEKTNSYLEDSQDFYRFEFVRSPENKPEDESGCAEVSSESIVTPDAMTNPVLYSELS